MERIQAMKVNFYTTDGVPVEERSHTEEHDSLEGLQNLVEEIIDAPDIPNAKQDILSFEFDFHIRDKEDVLEAIHLLSLTGKLLSDD